MTAFEIGRLCMKKTGREAGKQCVVVDVIDKNFVLVTGPEDTTGVRRRRANVDHLEPFDSMIDIRKGAGDDVVKKALTKLPPATTEPEQKLKAPLQIPTPSPIEEKAAKAVEPEKPKKKRRAKKEESEEKPRKRAEKKETKEAETETVEEAESEEGGETE